MKGATMNVLGYQLPTWAATLWAWLPWIVGTVAGVIAVAKNSIEIWESHTFRRLIGNRLVSWRVARLRKRLKEAEAESDYWERENG